VGPSRPAGSTAQVHLLRGSDPQWRSVRRGRPLLLAPRVRPYRFVDGPLNAGRLELVIEAPRGDANAEPNLPVASGHLPNGAAGDQSS